MGLTVRKLDPIDGPLDVIGPNSGYQAAPPPLTVQSAPDGVNASTPLTMSGAPPDPGAAQPQPSVWQQPFAPMKDSNPWSGIGNFGIGLANSAWNTVRLPFSAINSGMSQLYGNDLNKQQDSQDLNYTWNSSLPGQAVNDATTTAQQASTGAIAQFNGAGPATTSALQPLLNQYKNDLATGKITQQQYDTVAAKISSSGARTDAAIGQAEQTPVVGVKYNPSAGVNALVNTVGNIYGAAELVPKGINMLRGAPEEAAAQTADQPITAPQPQPQPQVPDRPPVVSPQVTPATDRQILTQPAQRPAEAPLAQPPITERTQPVNVTDESPATPHSVPVDVSDPMGTQFRLNVAQNAYDTIKNANIKNEVASSAVSTGSRDPVNILMDVIANSPNKGKIRTIIDGLGVPVEGNAKNRLVNQLVKTNDVPGVTSAINKAIHGGPIAAGDLAVKPKLGEPTTASFRPGEPVPAEGQSLIDQQYTKSGKPRVRQKAVNETRTPVQDANAEPLSTEPHPSFIETERPSVKSKPVKNDFEPLAETSIDPNDPFNNNNRVNSVRNVLNKTYERDAPMLTMLKKASKETGLQHEGFNFDERYYRDTGDINRAHQIATSKLMRDENFQNMLEGLGRKDFKRFKEYLKAKAESATSYEGKATSTTPEERAAVLEDGAQRGFDERYKHYQAFTRQMVVDARKAGLIDKPTYYKWMKSDDYVRVQRDVSDLANHNSFGKGNSRNFASTKLRLKRKGSTRDQVDPINALIKMHQDQTLESIRNRTASNLIDMLQSVGLAKRVKDSHPNAMSRFRNGKQEYWMVPKDIKEAVTGVTPQMAGTAAKIMNVIATPVRLIRAGATGLDPVFGVRNLLRDQGASFIQSEHALQTHNPVNIIKGIGSAMRDFGSQSNHPLWKEFESHAADTIKFDDLRLRGNKTSKAMLREVRYGTAGRVFNRAIAPVKTLEDFVGITEKATRFQNYIGTYEAVMKKTGNEKLALEKADMAARMNTTDFSRSGELTQAASQIYPFFNASVQGTRSMGRAFKNHPVAATLKMLTSITLPGVALTMYNMSDPQRRKVYQSINDFEKTGNFIIVLPGAHQDKTGTWQGVVKIPLPQGYRDLTAPVNQATENFLAGKPIIDAQKMVGDVMNAWSGPIDTSSVKAAEGSLIPQAIKPFVQAQSNENFYTGKNIVPDYMLQETSDPTQRYFSDTSPTAIAIGKHLGVSPLIVQQFLKDTTGSLGQYGQDIADSQLKAGKFDVGAGVKAAADSIASNTQKGFASATGTLLDENKTPGQLFFEHQKQALDSANLNPNEQAAFDSLHPKKTSFTGDAMYDGNSIYNAAAKEDIYNRYPKVFEVDKQMDAFQRAQGQPGNPFFDLTPEQRQKVLYKDTLAPGTTDPEVSNLKNQQWYNDYSAAKSNYYNAVQQSVANTLDAAKKSGNPQAIASAQSAMDKFSGSGNNPYPTMAPDIQKALDQYDTLPKGTGARSGWIKANPDAWNAIQTSFNAIDTWQNNQRAKLGLDATQGQQGQANGYSTSSSSTSGSSSSGKPYVTYSKKGSTYGSNSYSTSGSGKMTLRQAFSKYNLANPYNFVTPLDSGERKPKMPSGASAISTKSPASNPKTITSSQKVDLKPTVTLKKPKKPRTVKIVV